MFCLSFIQLISPSGLFKNNKLSQNSTYSIIWNRVHSIRHLDTCLQYKIPKITFISCLKSCTCWFCAIYRPFCQVHKVFFPPIMQRHFLKLFLLLAAFLSSNGKRNLVRLLDLWSFSFLIKIQINLKHSLTKVLFIKLLVHLRFCHTHHSPNKYTTSSPHLIKISH